MSDDFLRRYGCALAIGASLLMWVGLLGLGILVWAAVTDERLRELEAALADMTSQRNGWGDTAREYLSERDSAHAALKRAYTLLVSVQPCVERMRRLSPDDTALRLNLLLEREIEAWVACYRATREAPRG